MREMCQTFGITALGETVESWTLENEFLTAEVLTYGAALRRLVFGGVDVVLGYDTLSEYERNDGYVGATVGRVCNRIGGASFELNGKTYPLAKNDGENHLHGGVRGFDKYIWAAEPLADGLRLHRLSPDGEEGYPGTLAVSVTYRLAGESLRIEYEAESDADTLCSLTNHSYFNLNGGGTAMAHTLTLAAGTYLETSPGCLPTGRALPGAGTPFDFRAAKTVGLDIDAPEEQLRLVNGYDHHFCVDGGGLRRAQWRCWMPAIDQPALSTKRVRCQISTKFSTGAPMSSRIWPWKRTLTTWRSPSLARSSTSASTCTTSVVCAALPLISIRLIHAIGL